MVRRGSIGDSSSNDFSDVGGGSDTDTGSGVTGDDGEETTFGGGGGGGADDDDDFGGGGADDDDGFGGGDDDDSSGVVGGGGSRAGDDDDDDDTTFSGGGVDTDAPDGVTGGGTDTTFGGGRSSQNRLTAPTGETGAGGVDTIADTAVEIGETSDRGVGITRGPEGTELVIPDRDSFTSIGAAGDGDGFAGERTVDRGASTTPSPGDVRAAVTRFGQRQLGAVRRREGGQTALDRRLEGLEADTGIDLFPGEGDVVQGVERELGGLASDIREGRTIIPTPAEAEEFGADAAATTAVGGSGPELRVLDATLGREEALRGAGGTFARLTADAVNIPAQILGTARTAEAAGETGFNLAAGFVGRGVEEENIRGVDEETEQLLVDFGEAAGERGEESVEEATRTAVQGTQVAAERAQNNPGEALGAGAFFAASAVGGTAASTAATRGLSALPDRVRSIRTRRDADARVDFEEVTSERGAEGDLPLFETDTDAPTGEAVREIEERAADNPQPVLEAVDEDAALFQSTEAELGPAFEARRGSSELPGLFTSPDASPLRLDVGDEQSSSLLSTDVRLPRLSDFRSRDDRLAAFPGDRIEGFPDDATGSGRIPDGDDGFEPDPDTSGARFLDEDADEGTAFVRPQGGRTTELEAMFPPGSEFAQTSTLGVDLPSGRTVPIDVFRRGDDVPDAGGGALSRFFGDERGSATLGDDRGAGTVTIEEIDEGLRRLRRRDRDRTEGDPTVPAVAGGSGAPTAADRGGGGDTDLLIDGAGESVAPTETMAPTEPVPTVEELGVESLADFGRALSSPQFEGTRAEPLMSEPTGASPTPESSPFGGGSAPSSLGAPPSGGPSSPGAPPSGGPSSPGGPLSGPPSSPGAPPSGAPSSPGGPGGSNPLFPSAPILPPVTPSTRPPRRIDTPEGSSDDDRDEDGLPIFEEQFFRAVGTTESLVLGADAPGADDFSPPEAPQNTEPEPAGDLFAGFDAGVAPTVDDVQQGAVDAVADLQRDLDDAFGFDDRGGGGTMMERASGGTSALVDFSGGPGAPADDGGGFLDFDFGAPDPAPEPARGESRNAADELEQMQREGAAQGGDFFFGSLVGVDGPPAEPEPRGPPRRSEPDLDPDDDLGGVLL